MPLLGASGSLYGLHLWALLPLASDRVRSKRGSTRRSRGRGKNQVGYLFPRLLLYFAASWFLLPKARAPNCSLLPCCSLWIPVILPPSGPSRLGVVTASASPRNPSFCPPATSLLFLHPTHTFTDSPFNKLCSFTWAEYPIPSCQDPGW